MSIDATLGQNRFISHPELGITMSVLLIDNWPILSFYLMPFFEDDIYYVQSE